MKNYTIRFYGEIYDHYDKNDNRYYLLSIENGDKQITSKFVRANTNRDLTLIKDLVRYDRLVVCYYLENKEEKYIDNLIEDCHKLIENLVKGEN